MSTSLQVRSQHVGNQTNSLRTSPLLDFEKPGKIIQNLSVGGHDQKFWIQTQTPTIKMYIYCDVLGGTRH
jgi:hypothetical protein